MSKCMLRTLVVMMRILTEWWALKCVAHANCCRKHKSCLVWGLRGCPFESITEFVLSSCFPRASPSQSLSRGCEWGLGQRGRGETQRGQFLETQDFLTGLRSPLRLGQTFHGITLPSATFLSNPPFPPTPLFLSTSSRPLPSF